MQVGPDLFAYWRRGEQWPPFISARTSRRQSAASLRLEVAPRRRVATASWPPLVHTGPLLPGNQCNQSSGHRSFVAAHLMCVLARRRPLSLEGLGGAGSGGRARVWRAKWLLASAFGEGLPALVAGSGTAAKRGPQLEGAPFGPICERPPTEGSRAHCCLAFRWLKGKEAKRQRQRGKEARLPAGQSTKRLKYLTIIRLLKHWTSFPEAHNLHHRLQRLS